MKKNSLIVFVVGALLFSNVSLASAFLDNPEMSFLLRVDFGASLDLNDDARSPANIVGDHEVAYSMGAFLFGISAGLRFNEIVGIEGGWHDQRHRAHSEWGGGASYQQGHLALRLAWPLASRQTPVFRIGPAIGSFSYGRATAGEVEDNATLILGGMTSLTLEHEFVLGVVGTLSFSYLPLYRFGMDGVLTLSESCFPDQMGCEGGSMVIGEKDFTEGYWVHLVWFSAGFQFEWTFK